MKGLVITLILISVVIWSNVSFAEAEKGSIQCSQIKDSKYDLVLDCFDKVDVRTDTMNIMYQDFETFSKSFQDAQVTDIRHDGSDVFATIKIPIDWYPDLKSDVKFSSIQDKYILEFIKGDLQGSRLTISLEKTYGFDGTKDNGSIVNFYFQIDNKPSLASEDKFEFALDRGLDLLVPEAKKLQKELDEKLKTQTKTETKYSPPNSQKQTTETKQEQTELRGPPRIDSDNDGFDDTEDLCIYQKETFNGYKDRDGCPDTAPKVKPVNDDFDHDGISDDNDLCPQEPEDHDGDRDRDGCPDPVPKLNTKLIDDIDKDNIPDKEDLCPNEAEVYNGYIDWDGCPDTESGQIEVVLDDDNDGVLNHYDNCPNMKETHNGFKDNDGCPDAVMQNQPYQKTESVNPIPSWVKNNAKWYSAGSITERDFAQSLQYLIKDDQIRIDKDGKGSESQFSVGKIPSWVQNSAGWWADGEMTDHEFIKTIQYLVDEHIIKVY